MNPSVKNQPVKGKKLGTKSPTGLDDLGKFSRGEVDASIDQSMITHLRALKALHESESFNDAIGQYSQNLRQALKQTRNFLANNSVENNAHLESAALEVSNNALCLGAVNILKSSFELQRYIRCGALAEATGIVEEIELEYMKVCEGLNLVV